MGGEEAEAPETAIEHVWVDRRCRAPLSDLVVSGMGSEQTLDVHHLVHPHIF